MNENKELIVYRLLSKVFLEKAYSQIELNKVLKNTEQGGEYITMLFYGVLEKSIQFDYIISKLAKKKPKLAEQIIIKIGLYLIRYSNTPLYAAVNKTVDLAKSLGKGGVAGFINALLKNSGGIALPQSNSKFGLSVNASVPDWLIHMLIDDYGFDFAKELLLFENSKLTHIRRNGFNISPNEFNEKYPFLKTNQSECGYYVSKGEMDKLNKRDYIIQNQSSIIACDYYFEKNVQCVLDVCAAPGGKSAYLLEKYFTLSGNDESKLPQFTALDLHPHRVELLNGYFKNAYSKALKSYSIKTAAGDATIKNDEFINKFDLVICDVPCSGVGLGSSKPEIVLYRNESDIAALCEIQKKILSTSAAYVKNGGTLCYSTCSVLKKENDEVISGFLYSNPEFKLQSPPLKIFPHINKTDGFFAAKLIRGEK